MTFDEWMRAQGLSVASAKKYLSSVQGVMSEWAQSGVLVDGPLTSITGLALFHVVS